MRRNTALLALAVSLCTLAAQAGGPSKLPPAGYDKNRDPAADLAAAIPQAQRENKRILLEVGGEWCVYCRLINKVIHEDERLMKMLDDGFIVVKVNFSDDVKNAAFLSAIRRSRPIRTSSCWRPTAPSCSRRPRTTSWTRTGTCRTRFSASCSSGRRRKRRDAGGAPRLLLNLPEAREMCNWGSGPWPRSASLTTNSRRFVGVLGAAASPLGAESRGRLAPG